MGASKISHYTNTEIQRALVGRALAHPARIRIIEHLQEGKFTRPIDLTELLQLNPASVHNHIKKLLAAELVQLEFNKNAYRLHLNHSRLEKFIFYVNQSD